MDKKTSKKKTKKKVKPAEKKVEFDLSLPQNIYTVGEHVEVDKRIYISQHAYKEIHEFTKDKTKVETGGVLLGNIVEELGKTNIVIHAFIEAKYSEGTPTTLTFTHESWDYIHKIADKKYPDLKILGWIHTHPDFGIFLSDYDKFIQQNFFSEENQIAYVVDPIQHIEGFYFWVNEKIERCPGFYIFDKVGVKIEIETEPAETEEEKPITAMPSYIKALIGIMAALIVVLSVFCISLSSRLSAVENNMAYLNQNVAMILKKLGMTPSYQNNSPDTSTKTVDDNSQDASTESGNESTSQQTEQGTQSETAPESSEAQANSEGEN